MPVGAICPDRTNGLPRRTCLKILFLLLVVSFVFLETFHGFLRSWFSGNWSGGAKWLGSLTLPAAVYMVWTKRHLLRQLPRRPGLWAGSIITFLSCWLLILGRTNGIVFLQEVSFILAIVGLIWLLLGWDFIKVLYCPALYLLLMTHFLDFFILRYTVPSQMISATIAAVMLGVLGIPNMRLGQLIELPHMTIEVAPICSGLYSVTSFLILTVPLAYISQKKTWRQGALIGLSVCFAFLTNGMRIAAAGLWTYYNGKGEIHGVFNDSVASVAFGLFFVLLAFLATRGEKEGAQNDRGEPGIRKGVPCRPDTEKRKGMAWGLALLLLLVTAGWLYGFSPKPVALGKDMATFPAVVGGWRCSGPAEITDPVEDDLPDVEFRRTYGDSEGNSGLVYVAYYAIQGEGRKVFGRVYDRLHANAVEEAIEIDPSTAVHVKRAVGKDGQSVYFWYDIDGKILTDRFRASLATMERSVLKRRTDASIVIIEMRVKENVSEQEKSAIERKFIEIIFPVVRNHLS